MLQACLAWMAVVSSGLASLSRNQMSLNGHMEAGMEKGFYKHANYLNYTLRQAIQNRNCRSCHHDDAELSGQEATPKKFTSRNHTAHRMITSAFCHT